MRYVDDVIFYYGEEDIYSNFYPASYCYNGLTFATVEHGFQWEKAVTFGDLASAAAIVASDDPGEAKYLGRLIKGYDDDVWVNMRLTVMSKHVKCKFEQNKHIYLTLLKDFLDGYSWAEASRKDRTWGIGKSYSQAKGTDKSTWPGLNLMNSVYKTVGGLLVSQAVWLQQGNHLNKLKEMIELLDLGEEE